MTNRVRTSGAATDLLDEALNEYFMVINDPKVADQIFPFKKKPTNYVKYIAFFLTAVALAITLLFWSDIMKLMRGYSCPVWEDEEKCRILIADFNYNTEKLLDVNELISDELRFHPKIKPHIESQYAEKFDAFDPVGKGEELHRTCGFEFSLTGDLIEQNELFKMDFRIFSDFSQFSDLDGGEIEIGDLIELKNMIQNVDLNNSNHFIINRICIACASKRPELIEFVEENMIVYKERMTSPESYQHLNIELFSLHAELKDTVKMLKTLKNISDVGNNDYVLGAIEREEKIHRTMQNYKAVYETQSKYIGETQSRVQYPSKYQMKHEKSRYNTQRNKMILKRAEFVRKNPVHLGAYLQESLNDYRYLQQLPDSNNRFTSEINNLESLLGLHVVVEDSRPTDNPNRIRSYYLSGIVEDCNHGSTIAKGIRIDGHTIPLRRSMYRHTVQAQPGTKVTIEPPSGFSFSTGPRVVVELARDSSYNTPLKLNRKTLTS